MPTNPRRTRRDDFFREGNGPQMEAYAKSLGFPSFVAMTAVIDLGHRLSAGEKITRAHVDELATYYTNIPRAQIERYAQAINGYASPDGRLDALIGLVWSPTEEGIAQGRELVQRFTTESYSQAIGDKMDANRDDPSRRMPSPSRKHEPDTLRDTIARAVNKRVGPDREQVLNTLEPKFRRELLADQLDANSDARIRAATDPRATLRDSLSAAYDSHMLTDEAHEELDGADIEDSIGMDINRDVSVDER
jgi:hypothetical protein